MKVTLPIELIKYTRLQPELEIPGRNVRQVLMNLFNEYPQLYLFLMIEDGKEADRTSFRLNGEYLTDRSAFFTDVTNDDLLELGRDVPEGGGSDMRMVAGAVLFVVGTYLTGGAYAAFAPMLMGSGASLFLGGLAETIMSKPLLPSYGGAGSTSNVYTFTGIQNTTVAGSPIPIVYGRHRVGGHLANAYVDVSARSIDSFLMAQTAISEGEIEEVEADSLQVNGADAKGLSGVTVFWRAGDSENRRGVNAPLIQDEEGTENRIDMASFEIYRPSDSNKMVSTVFDSSTDHYTEVNAVAPVTSCLAVSFVLRVLHVSYIRINVLNKANHQPLGKSYLYEFQKEVQGQGEEDEFWKVPFFDLKFTINLSAPFTGELLFHFEYPNQLGLGGSNNIYFVTYAPASQEEVGDSDPAMKGFNRIENTNSYNLKITYVTPEDEEHGIIASTPTPANAARLVVSAPAFFKKGNNDSPYAPASVTLDIYYRRSQGDYSSDPGWQKPLKYPPKGYVVQSATAIRSEFVQSFEIKFPGTAPDYYDIRVIRRTEASTDMSEADELWLKDVSAITDSSLVYPCVALLGWRIKATDQISGGMPTLTSIVKGVRISLPTGYYSEYNKIRRCSQRYLDTWDGTMKTTYEWTDSPVWCLYNLLTNERYGLGSYFKIIESKRGLMLANFVAMSMYADQYIYADGTYAQWNSYRKHEDGSYEYPRPRFSLNLVIDESKSAREWINIICATMRATLFYCEGIFILDIDRVKPVSQLFNMSNLTDFTQSSLSYRSIPNTCEVQFPNRDKEFEMDSFVWETKEYQSDASVEERRMNLQLLGTTVELDARRLSGYALALARTAQTTVTFKTGTNALLATVTDVIGIQHDVPFWGSGGTVTGVVNRTLTLSVPFKYHPAEQEDGAFSGELWVALSRDGGPATSVQAIAPDVSGTYNTITILPGYVAAVGDLYVLGRVSGAVKPFKITSIKRSTDELAEVTAIEYNADVYTDDLSKLGDITMPDYSPLPSPHKTSVTNVKAEVRAYKDSTGNVKVGVDVWYTPPASTLFWKAVQVAYGIKGNYLFTASDNTGHVFIPDLTVEGMYAFVCMSLYNDGTRQSIQECLNDTLNLPFAYLYVSPNVGNTKFLTGVRGLEVVGSTDGSYYGKECRLRWRAPVVVDQFRRNTADGPAESNDTRSWLAYYQVEIKNPDGSLRRTAKVATESYSYTHEMNHEDGKPARSWDVSVIAIDRLGNQSKPATLHVTNPAPAVLTGFAVTPAVKSFGVSFNPSGELDIVGYVTHAVSVLDGGTASFDPSAANLINCGPESRFYYAGKDKDNILEAGTYYVKVAAYDTFEDPYGINYQALNYTSASTVSVLDDGLVIPPQFYDELRTDFIIDNVRLFFGKTTKEPDYLQFINTLFWDGEGIGRIIRGDTAYALTGSGSFDNAQGCYVVAHLDKATKTASINTPVKTKKPDGSAAPVPPLVDNDQYTEIVIAFTSNQPPRVGTNNIVYVRQSNSMEMEGAVIRNLTVGADAIVEGILTIGGAGGVSITSSAHVPVGELYGGEPMFAVATDGKVLCHGAMIHGQVHMGAGSSIDWDEVNLPPSTGVENVYITYDDSPLDKPPRQPTGDGTSLDGNTVNGVATRWHRTATANTKWMSTKTSTNISTGIWSVPLRIQGSNGTDGNDAVLPSFIHSTYIDETEIRSPTIKAGQFWGNTYILGDGVTYGKIQTHNFTATGTKPGIQIQDDPVAPTVLLKGATVRSATYVPGAIGWQIDANGNAQFNCLDVIGTLQILSGAISVPIYGYQAQQTAKNTPNGDFQFLCLVRGGLIKNTACLINVVAIPRADSYGPHMAHYKVTVQSASVPEQVVDLISVDVVNNSGATTHGWFCKYTAPSSLPEMEEFTFRLFATQSDGTVSGWSFSDGRIMVMGAKR